jgi:anti-sigma factor RsiW
MECGAVVLLLWEYLDGELGSEEAQAVGVHLNRCPRCYPAYRCDQAFLDLLARQRATGTCPPALVTWARRSLQPSSGNRNPHPEWESQ